MCKLKSAFAMEAKTTISYPSVHINTHEASEVCNQCSLLRIW